MRIFNENTLILIVCIGFFIYGLCIYINFKQKLSKLIFNKISIILISFFIFVLSFIIEYIFNKSTYISSYILAIIMVTFGFTTMIYFSILNIREVNRRKKLLGIEKIHFHNIKKQIKRLPIKKYYSIEEAVAILGLDRKTIKKYERELIRFTVIYSQFEDEEYAKEELELFIITDYIIKNINSDYNDVKKKIKQYAKGLKDLKSIK